MYLLDGIGDLIGKPAAVVGQKGNFPGWRSYTDHRTNRFFPEPAL